MRGSNAVLVALGLSAALAVTACGSGGTAAGPTGSGTPAVGASVPAAGGPAEATSPAARPPAPAGSTRVLGKAELRTALVGPGDIKGWTGMEMPIEIGKTQLSTRPADCQPIDNIRTGKIKPESAAYAFTTVGPDGGGSPTALTQIMLASFDGGGAQQVLADLRTALTTCTRYEGSIPKPGTVAALPAPKLGEEALSYSLTSDGKTQELTVVRQGSVVAVFSPGAGSGGTTAKVPQEVLAGQMAKVRTTVG
ncbi:hypothetical protein OG689_05735 [Kitasatospora sp. NBC_00240]|uniref:hypothetical protein n=1 Tax=Kitasatospora sp. NBC_00240 TaxID=2903567 RepID=UPI0022590FBB|nr:hypothetical protein [Kitasatospora sp. NBC_00240]MCX5208797.1 hypothetical protein [Kitasatospora sp. NBC_00240]